MGKLTRTIAIDFDGCLCEDAWPDIGEPYWEVIHAAIREQVDGASLILWTCRTGHLLSEAIEACVSWGLTFDAVNANLPERLEYYGTESRKISADEYWDDRSIHMPESLDAGLVVRGRWVWDPNGMDWNLGAWLCSECKTRNNNLPCNEKMNPYIFSGSKYCPNCGAKMCGGV